MAKVVMRLRKKHKDRIWMDEEGDFWFWDSMHLKWTCLMSDLDAGYHVSRAFDPKHYSRFIRIDTPTSVNRREQL